MELNFTWFEIINYYQYQKEKYVLRLKTLNRIFMNGLGTIKFKSILFLENFAKRLSKFLFGHTIFVLIKPKFDNV